MNEIDTKKALQVIDEVKKVIIGKDGCIYKVMAALLARGHILIEDIPGVGKTTMALAFSKAMSLTQSRMQFTPDVLPSDVTGYFMYENGKFQFHEGPIFCHLFLADEINRTSPKTQSALLEVMEEGTVTVDAVTKPVPEPFLVMATQNPIGSAGTQMLPESQLDRFIVKISMGYPSPEQEIAIMKNRHISDPMESVQPVISAKDIIYMQMIVEKTYIHDLIYQYIVQLIQATRNHEMIQVGVSPRGTLAVAKMAKAYAFLRERDYVVPDDVSDVFKDVAVHRIVLNAKARISKMTAEQILDSIIKSIKKPTAER
ncbi:MAG: MoxR family ATPase [Clostridiales bacterium]|nr:MoxR family ATPase [Clostridiales bacterium]